MDYLTNAEEILDIIQVLRPDFSILDINLKWIEFAETKVNADLEDEGISAPATDHNNYLKYATIAYYLEQAANKGQIQSHFGDIKTRQMGNVRTEFDPKTPMFFFARGNAKSFYALLPHETWLMSARSLIRSYVSYYARTTTGHSRILGKIQQDTTVRGYGWDERHDDYIQEEGYWK